MHEGIMDGHIELHSLLANEQGLDCIPEQEEDEGEERPYEGSERNGELTPGLISSRRVRKLKPKREVGLFGSISLVVGVMIGAGIYSSNLSIYKRTGSVGMSLFIWAGAGVIAMLSSLCYAELGTTIRKSGGERTYLTKIFGGLAGFLYSWTATIILKPCSLAAVAVSFGEYVAEPFFPYCGLKNVGLQPLVKIFAAIAIGSKPVAKFNLRLHMQEANLWVNNILSSPRILAEEAARGQQKL